MQEKKRIYYAWYMVLFGFLVMALAYASLASCQGIFIKPVTEELGIERATFSGVTIIVSVGLIIGSTFMGKLFGKYSLKKVMGTRCTIVCAYLAGFGLSSHIWQFYILGSIMGIAFFLLVRKFLLLNINTRESFYLSRVFVFCLSMLWFFSVSEQKFVSPTFKTSIQN